MALSTRTSFLSVGLLSIPLLACVDGPNMSDTAVPPPVTSCDFSDYPSGIYHFSCLNDGSNCYYTLSNHKVCVNHDVCVDVNPDEPTGGWQPEVKAACTKRCEENSKGSSPEECSDAHWSSVEIYGEANCMYAPCDYETYLFDFNLIESILGSAAADDAETLPCNLLWDDCLDYLDALEFEGMTTEPGPSIRNSADVLMESSPGGESQLYVIGAGQGTGTTKSLVGEAAYSLTSCGADACPFYLAQWDLAAASSFNITLSSSSGPITKTISNFSISLREPALGVFLPDSGDIFFPPNALTVIVSGTVSGSPEPWGENGNYENEYLVNGYVFGTLDAMTGDLILGAHGEVSIGDFSIVGNFVEE
jgi:hypothetical protein